MSYWHKLPTKTMWTVLTGPPDFFTLHYIQMIFSSSLAKATTPPSAHILLCCYVLFSSASPHFSAPLCLCFRFPSALFPGELRKSLLPQHRHGLFLTWLFLGVWGWYPSSQCSVSCPSCFCRQRSQWIEKIFKKPKSNNPKLSCFLKKRKKKSTAFILVNATSQKCFFGSL